MTQEYHIPVLADESIEGLNLHSDADVVDAINLTMSPRLGGFRAPSLSQAPHALRHFTCVSLTTDSDFVFARYERITTA